MKLTVGLPSGTSIHPIHFLRTRLESDFEEVELRFLPNPVSTRELAEIALARECDILIFENLQQIGLGQLNGDAVLSALAQLAEAGIRLLSIEEDIDTSQPAGSFVSKLMHGLLRQKKVRRSEHVRKGIEAARDRGKRLGRPMVRNDSEIKKLRNEGLSIREISSKLSISTWAVRCGLRLSQ